MKRKQPAPIWPLTIWLGPVVNRPGSQGDAWPHGSDDLRTVDLSDFPCGPSITGLTLRTMKALFPANRAFAFCTLCAERGPSALLITRSPGKKAVEGNTRRVLPRISRGNNPMPAPGSKKSLHGVTDEETVRPPVQQRPKETDHGSRSIAHCPPSCSYRSATEV